MALILSSALASQSVYTVPLTDPKAVYLNHGQFPVHGDGVADDTAAIQQAIDRVQETTRQGILFIPEGRYRLTKTLMVWPGIRLIGSGERRPVFQLADNTPGYQTTEKYMVFFAGRRGRGDEQPVIPESAGREGGDFDVSNEASPGTFYSAMSNIDMEIGEGNPAAVGIRGRYAQHCYLAHMDFHLRSGLAGVHDTGNEAHDLRFFGGDYGIITRTPSPGWQFTLLDSHFEGQTRAGIRTHLTGLTLIRPSFRNVPTAVSVDPDRTEQLWIKDGRFEDISGSAIAIGRENNPRTQINVEGAQCRNVATFALLRETGRTFTGKGSAYVVNTFSHGLLYGALGSHPRVDTKFQSTTVTTLPEPAASDVPDSPPSETWVNLRDLGARGDGQTDDTDTIRRAIAGHKTIYIPSGRYRVTDTISLKQDTILIGLNPITTQIILLDATPGFGGKATGGASGGFRVPSIPFPGAPRPLLEAPKGGTNIVTGIGLDTGGNNPSACGAKWMAGPASMIDDVKFLGGHGSNMPVYNANNSSDPNPARRWDSQYPSLWVTDGGGGTFKNIWTASTFAEAGLEISNTSSSGRVYQLSSEHHVRHEVVLRNASNWQIFALQTEEERGEGPFALPLEIDNSRNITIANLNMYRVVSVTQPFPYAVKVSDSKDIRFRGVHCYSNSKSSFDNLLLDASHNLELRQREFAGLTLTGDAPKRPATVEVEKLAGGFFNISGGAAAPNGDFYFVDSKFQRIYRWVAVNREVTVVSDDVLFPTNLFLDRSRNLIVVSYAGAGTVYSFRPGTSGVVKLTPQPVMPRPGRTPFLPVSDWLINEAIVSGGKLTRASHFVSPDGSAFLPVGQDFLDGALQWGVKLNDVIRSFGLAPATPGEPFYITGESEMRTYRVDVGQDGSISGAKLFAEQGGEGVAAGPDGKVYIAAGQIYVYSPDGRPLGEIDVPERPIQLVFGGKDGRTLYIAARTSLYAVRVR